MSKTKGSGVYWTEERLGIVQEVLLRPSSTNWQKVTLRCAKHGIASNSLSLANISSKKKLQRPYIRHGGHRWGIKRTSETLDIIREVVAKAESWNNAEDLCANKGINTMYYVIRSIAYEYDMPRPNIRRGCRKYY